MLEHASTSTTAKRGLLILNLGSPAAPHPKAVRSYLNEFLMDPYVIDLPWPLRFGLVKGIITPFRSHKSAEAYQKIWQSEGSPLVLNTKRLAERLQEKVKSEFDVRWGMRYGPFSIQKSLKDWAVNELFVLPMYPQYAESSTQTALDECHRVLRERPLRPNTYFLEHFHSEPEYISAKVKQIDQWVKSFRPDRLLLSFHGLPEHHLTRLCGSVCQFNETCCGQITPKNQLCYRAQSLATVREIQNQLNFPKEKTAFGFQSRLGRRPWIRPYTDQIIEEWARAGVQRVLVSCPSFVADCLETLEEIQMRLKEQFVSLGGEDLQLVPALNDNDVWVDNLAKMLQRRDLGWRSLGS